MAVEMREDGLVGVTVDVEGPQGVVAHTSWMTKDAALELSKEIADAFEAEVEVDAAEEDEAPADAPAPASPPPPAPAAAAPVAAEEGSSGDAAS